MRPWNPAIAEIWDRMSPQERRATARFDLAVAVLVICIMLATAS